MKDARSKIRLIHFGNVSLSIKILELLIVFVLLMASGQATTLCRSCQESNHQFLTKDQVIQPETNHFTAKEYGEILDVDYSRNYCIGKCNLPTNIFASMKFKSGLKSSAKFRGEWVLKLENSDYHISGLGQNVKDIYTAPNAASFYTYGFGKGNDLMTRIPTDAPVGGYNVYFNLYLMEIGSKKITPPILVDVWSCYTKPNNITCPPYGEICIIPCPSTHPDLVISSVSFSKNPCNEKDNVLIKFDVTNKGDADSDPCVDCLSIDGKNVKQFNGKKLSPGETRSWSYKYVSVPKTPAPHTIKVCADCNNQVSEKDESNNCKQGALNIVPKDPCQKNRPPNQPSILGPDGTKRTNQVGYKKINYGFSSSTQDPEKDKITYRFNWGDGQKTDVGPVKSGQSVRASHAWQSTRIYKVQITAIDPCGSESKASCAIFMNII